MPKRHQQDPAKSVTGNNNPSKTTEHRHEHSELEVTHKANSREREEDREPRNGSESNATRHRKGERVHEHDKDKKQPHGEAPDNFSKDLRAENRTGENHGPRDYQSTLDYSRTAYDIKSMYQILADLTDDELKSIVLVAEGNHLQQGAKYIDLEHLEQGEFVAEANMIAEAGHYYVPKKEVDYVLWNRLNQVDDANRLDESTNA